MGHLHLKNKASSPAPDQHFGCTWGFNNKHSVEGKNKMCNTFKPKFESCWKSGGECRIKMWVSSWELKRSTCGTEMVTAKPKGICFLQNLEIGLTGVFENAPAFPSLLWIHFFSCTLLGSLWSTLLIDPSPSKRTDLVGVRPSFWLKRLGVGAPLDWALMWEQLLLTFRFS